VTYGAHPLNELVVCEPQVLVGSIAELGGWLRGRTNKA
jgi:hypothetical protein